MNDGDGKTKADLRIEFAGREVVGFSWNEHKVQNVQYILQGVKPSLEFENVARTDSAGAIVEREVCDKYIGFRVVYGIIPPKKKDFVFVGTSNTISYLKTELDKIELKFIESYGGKTALSMQHEGIYDQYLIYDVTSGRRELVLATDDYIVVTDLLEKKHTYLVEGYVKREGEFALQGYSEKCAFGSYSKRGKSGTDPVLSVLVAVYNVQDFLPRCLDSVIASSLKDLRIVLIDDGSTDESRKICEWYCKRYDFVEVHDTTHTVGEMPNLSDTRNTGVKYAKTPWIVFMDGDDSIHPYAYEKLYREVVERDADIGICQSVVREGFGEHKVVLNPFRGGETAVECTLEDMMVNPRREQKYFCSMWSKIIKTDVAQKVKVPGREFFPYAYTGYEDVAYTPALYSYAKKLVVVRGAYYTWEKRYRTLTGAKPERSRGVTSEMYRTTYIYARAYSILACNPKRREAVDKYSIGVLAEKYTAYVNAAWGKESVKMILKVASYLCAKYNLLDNPYIKKEQKLVDFLQLAIKEKPKQIKLVNRSA